MKSNPSLSRLLFSRVAPMLVLLFSGALAMAQADPPARVANLSRIEGSVVFAPAGETEWANAELNRPVTRGDRVWTDPGARAELHLGSSAVHLDSQTFVDVANVDSLAFQASLNEGTVNARVRDLQPGENFELDTPQLAFRATEPGDYRVGGDAKSGTTRVIVRSGAAQVFGAGGESLQMRAGEQLAFTGRALEEVALQVLPQDNGFERWVADLNRREDQSVTARYVPRDVVGYQQLDAHGTWTEDSDYGAVWYPTVAVADWAPYRYGHWDFIAPWGWTWIENEPWGFAPFHYGRWAMIGSRWGWVPGRLGPRPVYSPALVGFVGGGNGVSFSLSIGGGSGIAWFPLAPGEAWRPYYHASDRYVRNINRYVVVNNTRGNNNFYTYQHRSDAVTAVNVNDFSRGRPVHEHWTRVNPSEIARAPATTMTTLPTPPRQFAEGRERVQPRGSVPPITASRPSSQFVAPGIERHGPNFEQRGAPPVVQRGEAMETRPQGRPRPDFRGPGPAAIPPGQAAQPLLQPPGQQRRDEQRALQEQRREQQGRPQVQQVQPAPQVQQERAQRAQEEQQRRVQMQQERAQRDQQGQQQRAQEEQQRRQQIQQERGQREQQQQQQQRQREAQERQQQSMQERTQRQQAMQERAQQQAAMQQQRAAAMQQRQAQQQQQAAPRGEARAHGEERGRGEDRRQQAHDRRDESRS
jgi:hypothetical protein